MPDKEKNSVDRVAPGARRTPQTPVGHSAPQGTPGKTRKSTRNTPHWGLDVLSYGAPGRAVRTFG